MRTLRLLSTFLSISLIIAAAGCDGGSSSDDEVAATVVITPESLTIVSGTGQTGIVGTMLAPMEVEVTTATGTPAPDILVTFAISSGMGTLTSPTVTTDSSGLASCILTLANTPGTMTVSASTGLGLIGEPATFTATAIHAAVADLVVTASPVGSSPNQTLTATVVELRDSFGNLCTSSSDTVTVVIAPSTGSTGAVLSGTTALAASGGTVQFSDLSIDLIGSFYQLEMTSGVATTGLTSAFDVVAGPSMNFGTSPSLDEQQGITWSYFTVEIMDVYGALQTWDNTSQVTVALLSGSGTLAGNLTRTAVQGICSFTSISYDTVESIDIEVRSTFAAAINAQLNIEAMAPAGILIDRVDVSSSNIDGNDSSGGEALSANGRYVAFTSSANNLVAGDTNGFADVFRHDRVTGATIRVSVGPGGIQADEASTQCSISANGRFVGYRSKATNLVVGDTNNIRDIFVYDCETGITSRVNLAPGGVEANRASQDSALSASGRFVAFRSSANNLVANDTNGGTDIFVHDRVTGVTERVSVDSAGNESTGGGKYPSLSADGRYVTFQSSAANLVPNDTNGTADIFVHDRLTGVTERVSVDSAGVEGDSASTNASISADGRYVAFQSASTNLVAGRVGYFEVYVHDRVTGLTERVSNSISTPGFGGNFQSESPVISGDGRYVAFYSLANDLVGADTNVDWDVFVYDRQTGSTKRISESATGGQSNGMSVFPSISSDGRYVSFTSMANNLAPLNYAAWHCYAAPNQ